MTRKSVAAKFSRAFGCLLMVQLLLEAPLLWHSLMGKGGNPFFEVARPGLTLFGAGIFLILFSSVIGAEMTGELEPDQEKPLKLPRDIFLLSLSFLGLMLLASSLSQFSWRIWQAVLDGHWNPVFSIFNPSAFPLLAITTVSFLLAFRAGITAHLQALANAPRH